MKKMICLATTAGIVILGCAAFASHWASSPQLTPPEIRETLLARYRLAVLAIDMMDAGQLANARAIAQSMISQPFTEFEIIEGHRLLSRAARLEGDFRGADDELVAALAQYDQRPGLAARAPFYRAMIVMDRADLALLADNPARAIELYDEVRQTPTARPHDAQIAARNAAMLTAQLGNYQGAVDRADAFLASPLAERLSTAELIGLRASLASWLANAGNLTRARDESLSLWNEYPDRYDASLLETGLCAARLHPMPLECTKRLKLASELLDRIKALRGLQTRPPEAPSDDELAALERQALVVIADSVGCDDVNLVNWAREKLGLSVVNP